MAYSNGSLEIVEKKARGMERGEAIAFNVIDVPRKRFQLYLESVSEEDDDSNCQHFAKGHLKTILGLPAHFEFASDLSEEKAWNNNPRKKRTAFADLLDDNGAESSDHDCPLTTSATSDLSTVGVQEEDKRRSCSRHDCSATSCHVQSKHTSSFKLGVPLVSPPEDSLVKESEASRTKDCLRGDKTLSETISSASFACSRQAAHRKKRKTGCLLGSVEKMRRIKLCVSKGGEGELIGLQCSKMNMRREVSDYKIEEDCTSARDESAIATESDSTHVFESENLNDRPLGKGIHHGPDITTVSEQENGTTNHVIAGAELILSWKRSDQIRKRSILKKGLRRNQIIGTSYMQTRSNALSCKSKVDGQVLRAGPVLRSQKNSSKDSDFLLNGRRGKQNNSGRMAKKKSASHAAKNMVVRALLEKYLRKRAIKFSGSRNPPLNDCYLSFLNRGAKRMVECLHCRKPLLSVDTILCSLKSCKKAYHRLCMQGMRECSWRNGHFICPQHACMACRRSHKSRLLHCLRCSVAAHAVCLPFPDNTLLFNYKPGTMICWRHSANWKLENKHMERTRDTQEIFCRLPLPYVEDDFSISSCLKEEVTGNVNEPAPYVNIRRNVYLIKKRRDDADDGVGCTCSSLCGGDCECRVQSMSCSKSCKCKVQCSNKPFRMDKRIKLVKTEMCGWGAVSLEPIKKGEFVIEYIGEVINEAICEERLWSMKGRAVHNFYMCEIEKDFIIDATFKGNPSRFLNHSCNPNCKLEKWRVDGQTRVGVFALRDITIGEPLTYDYKFIQFGQNVKCCCGALNCRGDLGEQITNQKVKTSCRVNLSWGVKHTRSDRKH